MKAQADGERERERNGYTRPPHRGARCSWCGDAEGLHPNACPRCGATEYGTRSPGRGEGGYAIRLVGLIAGGETHHDGRYLKDYNPWVSEIDERGNLALARIETTENPAEAMRFDSPAATRREWTRWDGWVRPDGRPSRPLTAFTVELARVP